MNLSLEKLKKILYFIKHGIEIKLEPSYTINKIKLYKKKSTKTTLLFIKFFNSVLNNIKILYYLNLFNFNLIKKFYKNIKNKNVTHFYFINTNINVLTLKKSKKKKKKLNKYRRFFVKPYTRYITQMLKKSCKMIIKFNFFKLFKTWFINKNRKNLTIINVNNIYVYCKEIFNCIFYFLRRTSLFYFLKLNNLCKFIKYKFNKLIYQKINIINFLYNVKKKLSQNKKIYKKIIFKLLLKILKYLIDKIYYKNYKIILQTLFMENINKNYIDTINFIKKKYIKKISYLFKFYTPSNIIFKNYWNFSFILNKKRKQNKIINGVLNKQYNFIYSFNNLINKYMFFIFAYWVNFFFKECIPQAHNYNNINIIFNYNIDKIFISNYCSLYYEKLKYRTRFKRLPKWCYLSYFKPSKFLLYLNKIT